MKKVNRILSLPNAFSSPVDRISLSTDGNPVHCWNTLLFHSVILILVFIISSCNSIQIENFPSDNYPEKSLFLTGHVNYQRNAVSIEELTPPLTLNWQEEYNGLADNSFTGVDSIIFFGTGDGYLFAINNLKGKEIGKEKLGRVLTGPPTISKNLLFQTYTSGDDGIIAYDLIEGDVLWEYEDNFSNSSPIVIDNKVFYQTNEGIVICLNDLTGEEIWSVDLHSPAKNSLAYDNDKIYAANLDGIVTALEYTSGIQIWQQKLDDKIFADPVIDGNFVYVATYDGYLLKMDKESGQIVIRKNFNIPIYNAVTVDAENIFIPLSNGELQAINKTSFKDTWTFKGKGPSANSVLITQNYAYFPTLGNFLYIMDKNSGKVLQEIELEGRARSLPFIKNGKLVISCENKYVNVFTEEN